MSRMKLFAAALILVGAALLTPSQGETSSPCPENCFLCHPMSEACCRYSGGRLLRC